jgi:flavin reductase (DIM6/NTAB) family NADH-FMN oxidoreductase RutF
MQDHEDRPSKPVDGKPIDVKTFWRAIGVRAIGAAVVTAADSNGPAGFLALSATHLTADPPTMMVSVDKRTSALATILGARHFAINYLPRESEAIANSFGGGGALKGADRFEAGRWTTLATGAPIFADAVGALDCTLEEVIERHGVAIVIGRLVDFVSNAEREPLISFRGGYR